MNKKILIFISVMLLNTGCSTVTKNTQIINNKESYVVGNQGSKHKLMYVDYDRRTNTTRKVTFYLNSFYGNNEFNLCEMDPKYQKDITKLIQKGRITKVNNFDKLCTSNLEILDNKDILLANYSIKWYTYFKSVHGKDKLPVTYEKSRQSQFIDKLKTTYVDGLRSYWKVFY